MTPNNAHSNDPRPIVSRVSRQAGAFAGRPQHGLHMNSHMLSICSDLSRDSLSHDTTEQAHISFRSPKKKFLSLNLTTAAASYAIITLCSLLKRICRGSRVGADGRLRSEYHPPQTLSTKLPAYISELIGTFFLVFTVGLNVSLKQANAPLSIGAILMVMIFAMGSVSGGHFNPSVTLGVALGNSCKFATADVPIYMLVQVLGGIAGAAMSYAMTDNKITVQPGDDFSAFKAFLAEMVFTMALAFVVLNVATSRDAGNHYFGLAIGFTVVSAAYAIGPISGCYLNPAVTLGVFAISFKKIKYVAVYLGAQLLGSALAALTFRVIRRSEIYDETRDEGVKTISILPS